MGASNRWLIGIGAALLVLVVVALAATLVSGGGKSASYSESTPEGVTQRYLAALTDKNFSVAYAYLSPALQTQCARDEWLRQSQYSSDQLKNAQALLGEVRNTATDEATVEVSIRQFQEQSPLPFPPSEFTNNQYFTLKKQAEGNWRFSVVPWPVYGCAGQEKPQAALPAATPASKP